MSSSISPAATGPHSAGARGHRLLSPVQDGLLVGFSLLFCYMHVTKVLDGTWTSAPFALEQGLLVGMFLVRRRSRHTSDRPLDWLVATGGWLPLVLQPHESGNELALSTGIALQWLGLSLTCVGFLYLGKSFGVVAANRGVKVKGPYRVVRHPIYATHTFTLVGFLLANLHPFNVALIVVIMTCQLLRIRAEERVLGESEDYREYAARVRWRLVPGLY